MHMFCLNCAYIDNVKGQVSTSSGCEYGIYDHTDSSNDQLLGDGWVPVTYADLSSTYLDDFIEFYNTNGGLPLLITWSSSNCCFAFSELSDTRLTINVFSFSLYFRWCFILYS